MPPCAAHGLIRRERAHVAELFAEATINRPWPPLKAPLCSSNVASRFGLRRRHLLVAATTPPRFGLRRRHPSVAPALPPHQLASVGGTRSARRPRRKIRSGWRCRSQSIAALLRLSPRMGVPPMEANEIVWCGVATHRRLPRRPVKQRVVELLRTRLHTARVAAAKPPRFVVP